MPKSSRAARSAGGKPLTVRSSARRAEKPRNDGQSKGSQHSARAAQPRAKRQDAAPQNSETSVRPAVASASTEPPARGKYVYCVIRSSKPLQFGLSTIAGEIGSELLIPASTLSHHLEKLKNEDLVSVRREGTFLRYVANTETLRELLNFLYAECCTRSKAIPPETVVQMRK